MLLPYESCTPYELSLRQSMSLEELEQYEASLAMMELDLLRCAELLSECQREQA